MYSVSCWQIDHHCDFFLLVDQLDALIITVTLISWSVLHTTAKFWVAYKLLVDGNKTPLPFVVRLIYRIILLKCICYCLQKGHTEKTKQKERINIQ